MAALASPSGLAGAILYSVHSMVVMTAIYFASGIGGALVGSNLLSRSGGIYAANATLAFTTLALFLSVAGLPPFSGLWPKVMLVKASLDVGEWWLAASILLTGFLTTICVGRIWALAYWRPRPPVEGDEQPTATAAKIAPTAVIGLGGLTALTVVFGLWPEPLIALSQDAARGLLDPSAYVLSVFPGEVPR